MKRYQGKVAVITGAASGIGYAMAERFVALGMAVVMADVEAPALESAAARLAQAARGPDESEAASRLLAVPADVASAASVAALARAAVARFGTVHLLCNNAGVGAGALDERPIWDVDPTDWQWAVDINVTGVLNGLRAFMPILRPHGANAHIINTASRAGLLSAWGVYAVTKHAVVAISETLAAQIACVGAGVGVSVLCPGSVATNLAASARKRPSASAPAAASADDFMARASERLRARIAQGRTPAFVVDRLIDGLARGDFYIFVEDEDAAIGARFDNIRARRAPQPPAIAVGTAAGAMPGEL